MWRDFFSRRRSDGDGGRHSDVAVAADVWERAGKVSAATLPILAKVEKLALKVYGEYNLPTQPGHYRRGPETDGWVFMGEHVDADIRWALVLENPPEEGWRYATLEDIGRYPGAPTELKAASNLLTTSRHLKLRLTGREPGNAGDDIETAIRLGVDWQELQDLLAQRQAAKVKLAKPKTPQIAAPEPLPEIAEPAPVKPTRKPRKRKTQTAT